MRFNVLWWSDSWNIYIYMWIVGIWLCHIPTQYHVRFLSGGNLTVGNILGKHTDNLTGGNMLGNHNDNDNEGDQSTSPWMTPSSPARPKPKSFRCFNVNLIIMMVVQWWWWWWWWWCDDDDYDGCMTETKVLQVIQCEPDYHDGEAMKMIMMMVVQRWWWWWLRWMHDWNQRPSGASVWTWRSRWWWCVDCFFPVILVASLIFVHDEWWSSLVGASTKQWPATMLITSHMRLMMMAMVMMILLVKMVMIRLLEMLLLINHKESNRNQ